VAEAVSDLAEFEVWLAEFREAHRAGGPGSGRFSSAPRGSIDALSCADFAVIDYTLGPWPPPPSEQDSRVRVIQGFQDAKSGFFGCVGGGQTAAGLSSDPRSLTGYVVAALELLGVRPLHPIRALDGLRTPDGMETFLEGLDWSRPALVGCVAAAVVSCFAVTGDVGPEWFERFFGRLARESDPGTGLWPRDGASRGTESLEAAFGLLVAHERHRRPIPHPAAAVRTTLGLQRPDGLFDEDGPGWREVAAAFVLDRALRQSGEAHGRAREACERLLRAADGRIRDASFLQRLFEDPHRTAGTVSLLAILSAVLPGRVRSRRPLRLFLERHLFV
jgi:hypothetical protein